MVVSNEEWMISCWLRNTERESIHHCPGELYKQLQCIIDSIMHGWMNRGKINKIRHALDNDKNYQFHSIRDIVIQAS